MRVNFILENSWVRKVSGDKIGWISSYIPKLKKYLENEGIMIDIDGNNRNYDIFHSHVPLLKSLNILFSYDSPFIFHSHAVDETYGGLARIIIKKYFGLFANKSDLIITPSSTIQNYLIDSYDLNKNKVVHVFNGIDSDYYSFSLEKREYYRKKYEWENKIIIMSVGALAKRKGIDIVNEVAKYFKENKDVEFVWVGSSYYNKSKFSFFIEDVLGAEEYSEDEVSHFKENIDFLGWSYDVPGLLSAADVFFLPSRHETFGLVVGEAASVGLPILVSDLDVFKEFCKKDVIYGRKIQDYINILEDLIENENKRKQLSKKSKNILKRVDLKIISKQLIKIYEDLLD